MVWVNHKLATAAIVYAITDNPLTAALCAAGSIIPDAIEGFPKDEASFSHWQRNHRRLSHWLLPYTFIFLILYVYAFQNGLSSLGLWVLSPQILIDLRSGAEYIIIAHILSLTALGACFHIGQDAICGKVPALNPKERIGIKLFKVGSFKEYALVLPLAAITIFLRNRW